MPDAEIKESIQSFQYKELLKVLHIVLSNSIRSFQYEELLKVGNTTLPDPLKSNDGWVNETDGVKLWPHINCFEIDDWLLNEATCVIQTNQ